jgi:hypothetical protein
MATTTAAFRDATPLLQDPEALRGRGREDGFLFFKQLLPKDLVMELRRQFLTILDSYGWLEKDTDLMDGEADREAVNKESREAMTFGGVGVHRQGYEDVQRLQLFHALAHHPNIIR